MADPAANRDSFRWQADFCARSGMPIITAVCVGLADALDRSTGTGARALDWPGDPIADALPLRLVGGVHALFRAGASGALDGVFRGETIDPRAVATVIAAALADHDAALLPWLDGPPQTNEPARSGVLLAGLLSLARRFAPGLPPGPVRFELLEIGRAPGST